MKPTNILRRSGGLVWVGALVALAGCQALFGVELPGEDAVGAGAAGATAGGGTGGVGPADSPAEVARNVAAQLDLRGRPGVRP